MEGIGEDLVAGDAVEFGVGPELERPSDGTGVGSRADVPGLFKGGTRVGVGPPTRLDGGLGARTGEGAVVGAVDVGGEGHHGGKVPGGFDALADYKALRGRLFGHDHAGELLGSELVENATVGILHGGHPIEVPADFVKDVRHVVAAFGNVQIESIEVRLVLLVELQERIGRNAGIHDVLAVVTGVVPALGSADGRIGGFVTGGGVVLDGSIRVACRTGVDAGVFFFEGGRGSLEVEELEGALGDVFVGVVIDNDGVADFFVADEDAVGAGDVQFGEVHERGALAGRFPGLRFGSGYGQYGFTFGILEDDLFAGCVSHRDLLETAGEETHLVLVNGGGGNGDGRTCRGYDKVLEVHGNSPLCYHINYKRKRPF